MIDFEAYKLYSLSGIGAHGSLRAQAHVVACKCQLCFDKADSCTEWMRNFAADSADEESAATDANYLLLPARVLGYCFNPKIWAQFYVKRVRAIDPPNVAKVMGRLVFPEEAEGVKEDLKTLIEQHGKTGPPLIVDPIKGKGTGLVILLHGTTSLHGLKPIQANSLHQVLQVSGRHSRQRLLPSVRGSPSMW